MPPGEFERMSHDHHRLIVFDVDGTLLLSGPVVRSLFARAFEEVFEVPAPLEDLPFAGRTDRGIVRALCERSGHAAGFDDGFPRFSERYTEHMRREYPAAEGPYLLPGVRAVLEALGSQDRVTLMLGTGNLEATARVKLERFAIEHFFVDGVYGNHHEDRTELFAGCLERGRERHGWRGAAAEVWFVGDTVDDVRAAQALGARCLALGTGPPGIPSLEGAGAEAFLPDLSATERALGILLG